MFLIITYIIHTFENLSSLPLDLLDVCYIINSTNINTNKKMDRQKETIGIIVKNARLKQGLSQGEVAQKASIQQSYLSQIESDKGRPPTIYVIEKIAFALNLDAKKLIKLLEVERFKYEQGRLDNKRKDLGIKAESSFSRPIPILSEIPAGHPKDYTDQDYPPGIAEEYYEFKIEDPDAFFLRAEGDCMAPEIKEGDLLLIYPNDKIKTGDIVIVRNNKEEKEVRRITIQPDQIILTAENPIYPVRVWRKKDKPKIIGRVKEIIRRR